MNNGSITVKTAKFLFNIPVEQKKYIARKAAQLSEDTMKSDDLSTTRVTMTDILVLAIAEFASKHPLDS